MYNAKRSNLKRKKCAMGWLRNSLIWLILLLPMGLSQSHAGSSAASIMSSAMLTMMDTMGDLAHRYKRGDDWHSDNYRVNPNPYSYWASPTYPEYYPPTQPPGPYPMPPHYTTEPRSEVDGIWIGQGGEIVLVMYGYFRVYADTETYRDGRYQIDGDLLHMHDLENGMSQTYQYALDSGRMIMRNREGVLLLFKQLPIPIPPQTLIPPPQPQIEPPSDTDLLEEPDNLPEK
ncbi:MAG: hypothetical protein JAZ20_05180 [Candidatus Thiodiazotropha weberae]|nr:hypothetical protein [Candidatus Thiodiazotropha lotti]MCW4206953.1 hypothetical protein [Candidatus Thiodiazotropha lotti]